MPSENETRDVGDNEMETAAELSNCRRLLVETGEEMRVRGRRIGELNQEVAALTVERDALRAEVKRFREAAREALDDARPCNDEGCEGAPERCPCGGDDCLRCHWAQMLDPPPWQRTPSPSTPDPVEAMRATPTQLDHLHALGILGWLASRVGVGLSITDTPAVAEVAQHLANVREAMRARCYDIAEACVKERAALLKILEADGNRDVRASIVYGKRTEAERIRDAIAALRTK